MRHGLDSASSESWPADSPCRCPPPPLSPASSSSSAYRRHSVTLSSGPSHYGNRSPPPVTLVAAAPDSTTPAITMTMAPQDGPFSLPNSMGALFLSGCASGASMTSPLMMDWVYEQSIIQSKPNCGPTSRTMRRYSHEIPREFSIPSMLQNFSLTSMGPTVGPSMSLSVGSPSSSIQQRFPALPGGATSTILRSYSLPRNVDSLTTAAGPSPCFSISHMPGFALAQGRQCGTTLGRRLSLYLEQEEAACVSVSRTFTWRPVCRASRWLRATVGTTLGRRLSLYLEQEEAACVSVSRTFTWRPVCRASRWLRATVGTTLGRRLFLYLEQEEATCLAFR